MENYITKRRYRFVVEAPRINVVGVGGAGGSHQTSKVADDTERDTAAENDVSSNLKILLNVIIR